MNHAYRLLGVKTVVVKRDENESLEITVDFTIKDYFGKKDKTFILNNLNANEVFNALPLMERLEIQSKVLEEIKKEDFFKDFVK